MELKELLNAENAMLKWPTVLSSSSSSIKMTDCLWIFLRSNLIAIPLTFHVSKVKVQLYLAEWRHPAKSADNAVDDQCMRAIRCRAATCACSAALILHVSIETASTLLHHTAAACLFATAC